jgi:hypothetical protein
LAVGATARRATVKLLEWLRRYGAAELVGTCTALTGAWLVQRLGGNAVAAAYGGALGENVGFYGTMIIRELVADRRIALASGRAFGPLGALHTAAGLLLEFGPAELLDSLVLRPLAMGIGTRQLGWKLGVVAGKLAADVTFYVPVILTYELRRRTARSAAAK